MVDLLPPHLEELAMIRGFSMTLLAALVFFVSMSGAQAGFMIGNLDGNDGTSSPNLTGGRIKAMRFALATASDYLLTDAILRLKIKGDGVIPIRDGATAARTRRPPCWPP